MDRSRAVLVGLWLLATALNVAKPYAIDDAFYVAEARWIAAHPDRPTSGLVDWEGTGPEPFHRAGNHAPLVPALLAAVIVVVGDSSIALHLVMSVFTAIVVWLVHRLARRHAPGDALAVTALVVLSPALVAEQNVMLDVPLLATWLAFFVALDEAHDARGLGWIAAGAAVAVALLVKLSSVVLLVALLARGVAQTRAGRLAPTTLAAACLLPLGALGLWGAASLAEVGEIAFLSRAGAALTPTLARGPLESLGTGMGRVGLAAIVLGGIAPAGAVLVPAELVRRGLGRTVLAGLAALAGLVVVSRLWVLPLAAAAGLEPLAREPFAHSVLRVVDLGTGAALLALVASRLRSDQPVDRDLARWAALGTLAAVGLAPFVAARHLLLVLPPVWLLAARAGLLRPSRARTPALVLGAMIGVGAAVADHRLASVYATEAPLLAARGRELAGPEGRVRFAGHWGWQEHAAAAGMAPLEGGALGPGDVLVVPLGVHGPALPPDLIVVAEVVIPFGPLDLVRTMVDREGLYVSWYGLPWSLRTDPLERFRLLRAP